MSILLSVVTAAALLALAMWAQWQIPQYAASNVRIAVARSVLLVVGIGFGAVTASYTPSSLIIGFLMGFGFVHLPAAMVLFLKKQMQAGPS